MTESIKTGNVYESFTEASSKINKWCQENFHPIKINRSIRNDSNNPDFNYNLITYTCAHGGTYTSKSKGIRPKQTSFAIGCPFKINVRLNKKPNLHYKITQTNLLHNHEIGPNYYCLYPKQRRLNFEEKNEIKDLISCNISNKNLKQFVAERCGKNLTSYDISNLKHEIQAHDSKLSKSDLLIKELNKLIETDECNVHLETDENNVFQFLLIQTKIMRYLTQKFSTVLFIDATYKVNIEGFPLYSIICEDNYGVGRPLCYIFVINERASTIKPAFKKFIELNPTVTDMCKIIMTDKDLNEINIIKELFPNAINMLCIFHILKYWKLKVGSLNLNSETKNNVNAILYSILYSDSEEIYFENLEKLKMSCPSDFFSYFEKNWHSCKEKYVKAYTKKLQHLGNTTNNRIESHNQKIKAFLKPEMKLNIAVKEILNYMKNVTNSLLHASFKELKGFSNNNHITNLHNKFADICTKKACSLIFEEIEKFQEGTYKIEIENDNLQIIFFNDKVYSVENLKSCTCSFNSQYSLPCQHIFATRFGLQEQLFDKDSINNRWLKTSLQLLEVPYFKNVSTKAVSAVDNIHTGKEKFKYARTLTDRMASLLAQCGDEEFQEKIHFFSDLLTSWEKNEEVFLHKKDSDFKTDNLPFNSDIKCENSNITFSEVLKEDKINQQNQNVDDIFNNKLIIPTIKHRRGRAKDAFSPYNITFKSKVNLKPNLSKKIKNCKVNINKKEIERKQQIYEITPSDLNILCGSAMLNDDIINAGQELIKLKFPSINGLQDVILGAALQFREIKTEFVQILHCKSFLHWIAASTIAAPPGTVHIYDSKNEPVPRDAIPQLCQIMKIQEQHIIIISKEMQTQPEKSLDCGLFALAAIVTILNGGDPSKKTYDLKQMRSHLLLCIQEKDIKEFPTNNSYKVCRSIERMEILNLNCHCRQPVLQSTYKELKRWVICNVCNTFYHVNCKITCCRN